MDGESAHAGAARPEGTFPELALAVLLLALAGFVDAVGFLGFGLFPSFMSGDTTQLAAALQHDERPHATILFGVVIIFVAGAFLGRLLRLRTGGRAPGLWVEAALLGLAGLAGRSGFSAVAVGGAVLAMGVQATALTHAGKAPVGATFVTGALARLGSGLADALAGGARAAWATQALMWAALVGGAAAGALCYGRVGLDTLFTAALVAALAAAVAGLAERRQPPRTLP